MLKKFLLLASAGSDVVIGVRRRKPSNFGNKIPTPYNYTFALTSHPCGEKQGAIRCNKEGFVTSKSGHITIPV